VPAPSYIGFPFLPFPFSEVLENARHPVLFPGLRRGLSLGGFGNLACCSVTPVSAGQIETILDLLIFSSPIAES